MFPSPKIAAMSLGLVGCLSLASLAQPPGTGGSRPTARSQGETLVVPGQIDWIEKSDVTALREGVIKQIEFQVGDYVEAEKPIGYLHSKTAELAVAKANVAATSTGAVEKAKAQQKLSMYQLAMLEQLQKKDPRNVSFEELQKSRAEVAATTAAVQEAEDNRNLAKAELALAQQALSEHTIVAPFSGYVTERMKNPGESIRASEAVVRLVRTDRLRFFGYVPFEYAQRVHVGDTVEVVPIIDDADVPIEKQTFKGKVTALNREIASIARTEVQVLAEIENPPNTDGISQELLKGMKGDMTIHLRPAATTTVGVRTPAPSR